MTKTNNRNSSSGCLMVILFIGGIIFAILNQPASPPPTPPPPTATPDKSDLATYARQLAGSKTSGKIIDLTLNDFVPSVVIKYQMLDNRVNLAILHMSEILCSLKSEPLLDGYTHLYQAKGDFVDAYGNPVDVDGFAIRLLPDAVGQINCDNIASVSWERIADFYEVHPLLKDS